MYGQIEHVDTALPQTLAERRGGRIVAKKQYRTRESCLLTNGGFERRIDHPQNEALNRGSFRFGTCLLGVLPRREPWHRSLCRAIRPGLPRERSQQFIDAHQGKAIDVVPGKRAGSDPGFLLRGPEHNAGLIVHPLDRIHRQVRCDPFASRVIAIAQRRLGLVQRIAARPFALQQFRKPAVTPPRMIRHVDARFVQTTVVGDRHVVQAAFGQQ